MTELPADLITRAVTGHWRGPGLAVLVRDPVDGAAVLDGEVYRPDPDPTPEREGLIRVVQADVSLARRTATSKLPCSMAILRKAGIK